MLPLASVPSAMPLGAIRIPHALNQCIGMAFSEKNRILENLEIFQLFNFCAISIANYN